jgi:hypothetical protein
VADEDFSRRIARRVRFSKVSGSVEKKRKKEVNKDPEADR